MLKARRLTGLWEPSPEEDLPVWLGPSPDLPIRRSWLGERIASGMASFAAPSRPFEGVAPPLAPISPDALHRAMIAALARERRPAPIPLSRPTRISVDSCSTAILAQLGRSGELRLSEVTGEGRDAHIAAFLAGLILARQGRVALSQDELFGEIVVRSPVGSLELPA
jgi:chromatin segregation and condensation protein Rec8/ScpA/Scc1 (kleisin family)